ncbi:MAG: LPS assembly lipoprotein LptE [Ginsengibacter sp.]
MKFTSITKLVAVLTFIMFTFSFATCRYSTKDTAPIPAEITTFKVNYFENKARYVNPQLSPQLTDKVKQKIIGQTRLRQVNDDDANYNISGYLSDYSVTTSGIANQQAGTNRLNVTFHLIFKNSLDAKKNFEADLTSNYDFSANKTLPQAESELIEQILKNISEAIFNRIFSNW